MSDSNSRAEYIKDWRLKNADRIKKNRRAYYLRNAEKIKSDTKSYAKRNPDKWKKYCATYRKNNKKKELARHAKYAANNKERYRLYSQNRRNRIKKSAGTLTSDLIEKRMKAQRGRCACCKAFLRETGYHLDHIEPLSKGGRHDNRNIQLLCPTCNKSKAASDPIVFMQKRGYLL